MQNPRLGKEFCSFDQRKDQGLIKLRPFLKPGEKLITNAGQKVTRYNNLKGKPDEVSLDEYVAILQGSGKYETVRVVENAAFDVNGDLLKDNVAIVGKIIQ